MANLIGVKDRGAGFIEYNGDYYEAQHVDTQAVAGDIVRHDRGYSYLPAGSYSVLDYDLEYTDRDGDYWSYDSDNDTLFRKIPSISESLVAKRTQLATLTAEIAQLEAQLAEESRLKVGDYARVISTYSVDFFELEDIVRITDIDSTGYPFYGESPINGRGEWFAEESIEKITSEEARASLIAKIEAHFNPEGGAESRE